MKKKLKIENETLKKMLIMNVVIVSGLVLANIVVMIKKVMGINVQPVLSDMIPISDFTDVIKFSVGKLRRWATGNYFPFTYAFMGILEFFSSGKHEAIYFIVAEICALIYIEFCRRFLKNEMSSKAMYINILIFLFMQFPMLFAFQRGNIEIIILVFCMLFYVLYEKEKYNLAAIVLSFAVCMKLYPALLAMLFISRKKYKSFLLCAVSSLIITVLSYFQVQKILVGFTHYLSGFTNFIDIYGKVSGMQYNHSILFGIYYVIYKTSNLNLLDIFSNSIMTAYTIGIICIAIPLILYITFKKMEEWKKVTLFTLMMVSFPQISFDYTLILLIIPIMIFVSDKNTKKWENITYPILFRITFNTNEYK